MQYARAARLRYLFEPWSLRKLEARTGIGRGTLQGRFNGATPLSMSDIEVLAPVIRMTPVELFSDLLAAGTQNGPASEETGPGSVRPLGFEPRTHWLRDNVTPMRPRNRADKSGPKRRAA